MPTYSFVRRAGLVLAISLTSVAAMGQTAPVQAPAKDSTYAPSVGQPGKDVVWVPTPQALVDKMLDMAKMTPQDYVIDLGSGDGRTVITAAKRGARALGIEYNEDMVTLSRRNAEQERMTNRAQFVKMDLFQSDLSKATVITMFLLPEINLKLRPKILDLKPGTRIVSNSFNMGEWKPDESATLDESTGCERAWCTALLWIVPAKVAGTHKIPQGELTLDQSFQELSGKLTTGGKTIAVTGRIISISPSLNYIARAHQHRLRNRKADGFRGLEVDRLNLNFVGWSTGISPGLAPFKTRSMYSPMR